jgi:hypothetical protein
MRYRPLLLLVLALPLLVGCGARETPHADVAVSIDGQEIPYRRFEEYLRRHVDPQDPPLEDAVQSRLFDQFLDEQLLIRLAVERGLRTGVSGSEPIAADGTIADTGPDHRRAVAFLLRDTPPPSWSEAELAAYYEAHRRDFVRPEQVRLRQILVQERERAEEARAAVERGAPFPEVAARFSQGPKAHLGGDQGRLGRDDLTAGLVDVIFGLEPGEVSDVVAADYGFLIFQVVERYPAETLPLVAARSKIRRVLLRRYVDQLVGGFVETARQRYNVEIHRHNIPFDYGGSYAN